MPSIFCEKMSIGKSVTLKSDALTNQRVNSDTQKAASDPASLASLIATLHPEFF